MDQFHEDCGVPFVQLVYENPEVFVKELLRDQLAATLQKAAEAHPDCSLGIVVVGLDQWMTLQNSRRFREVSMRRGGLLRQLEWALRMSGLRWIGSHGCNPGLLLVTMSFLPEECQKISAARAGMVKITTLCGFSCIQIKGADASDPVQKQARFLLDGRTLKHSDFK